MKAKKDLKIKSQKAEVTKIDNGEYQVIEVSRIKLSKFDCRKVYKKEPLEELTKSVKEKGVLEPVTVRPVGKDFEIVFGRRRRLASIDAGLKKIPAIIKNLTDAEALEYQLIENEQREDVNPLYQAQGYKKLLDMGKHTPETLAARLGHTTSYVYGRLKFLDLPQNVQNLIAEEKLSAGHAVVLARLRDKKQQEDIARDIVLNNMSVRRASEIVKNCSVSLKMALFDTAHCAKCEFNTDNQALLFPDVKKTGECTDVNCFNVKKKAYYEGLAKDIKAQGFKVITTEKEMDTLSSRNAEQICPPESRDYHETKPKKYKSECMKCTEHHVFAFFEKKQWDNSKIMKACEFCLNRKCLDKMNGRDVPAASGSNSGDSGSGRISPHTIAAHATACRDRFLRANLPGKVEASETLQKRLLIYTLILKYGDDFDEKEIEMLKELMPSCDGALYDNEYALAAEIDKKLLDTALQTILMLTVPYTNPDVLLEMTPEAGIDMTKDFGPDEEFLSSKTKDELVTFIGTHKLTVEIPKSGKKGDIVKAILTQDLKGKHTKELRECVEIEKEKK